MLVLKGGIILQLFFKDFFANVQALKSQSNEIITSLASFCAIDPRPSV